MDSKTPELQELSVLLRHVPQVVVASLTRKPRQEIIPDPSSFTAAVALFDIAGVSALGSNLSDLEKDQIKALSLTTVEADGNRETISSLEVVKKFRGHNKVGTEYATQSQRAPSPGSSGSGRRKTSATYSSSTTAQSIAAGTLTTTINKSFQPIIDVISRHSGDIIKFAGDTMIVLWETEISLQMKTPAGILAYRAARCAVEALRALRSPASAGHTLSMKIGIGTSEVTPHYVGGVRDRWEFCISGSANQQMSLALRHAPRGNVALSFESYGALAYSMAMKELRNVEMNVNAVEDGIHIITTLSHSPLAQASRYSIRPSLEVIPVLRGYVPGPIVHSLEKGQSITSSARDVTVLSIKLFGVVEMEDPWQQFEKLQRLVRIIQSSAYKLQGTLKHLIFDGKSAVVIVVIGLPPFYHEDNAVRGAQLACALFSQGVQASIGMTTGSVFCGPVGCKARIMYTVAGMVVDLAKGMMLAAKLGEALCDTRTQEEAKRSINFSAAHHISVRNTAEPLAIYCVLGETAAVDTRAQSRLKYLPSGCDHVLNMVAELDKKRDRKPNHGMRLFVVSGEAGTGKTMLVQYLHHQQSQSYLDTGKPDNTVLRLRAWSGIVREMISQNVSATQPCIPEKIELSSKASNNDSLLTLEEMCQSRVNSRAFSESLMKEIEQVPGSSSQDALVSEDRIPLLEFLEIEGYVSSAMLAILNDLLPRDRLFQTDMITFQQGEERAKALEEIIMAMLTVLSKRNGILLLFDNAHLMDEDSWLLLRRALEELPNVCALMTVRSKRRVECPSVLDHVSLVEYARQVELALFSSADTSQFLSKTYQIATMDQRLLDFVYNRTNGNPGEIVKLIEFMIERKFISIDRNRGLVKILSGLEDLDSGIPQHTRAHVIACVDDLESVAQIAVKVVSVSPGPVRERLLLSILQVFLNSQYDSNTNDMADIQIKSESLIGQLRIGLALCLREGVLYFDTLERKYFFQSEEMRLVVYDLMIPSQRQLIHMLYCQWFTELCNSSSGSMIDAKLKSDAEGSFRAEASCHRYLSRVAYHLLGAQSVRESLNTYQKAAEKAIEVNDLYFASEYLISSLQILDEQALYSNVFSELDLIAMRSRIEFVHGTIAVRNHDWDKAIKHMKLIVTMCDSKATTLRRYSSEIYVDTMLNELLNIRQPRKRATPVDTRRPETTKTEEGMLRRCIPSLFCLQLKPKSKGSMRVTPVVDVGASESLRQVNHYRTKAILVIKSMNESKLKQTVTAQEVERLMNQPPQL